MASGSIQVETPKTPTLANLAMEVREACSSLLSNYEVLELLREVKKELKGKSKSQRPQGLSTIVYETVRYLDQTPAAHQTAEILNSFMESLQQRQIKLTKAEKLQLLNRRPETPVELQLLIEECVERFSEDQEADLLDLIGQLLPLPPAAVDTTPEDGPPPAAEAEPPTSPMAAGPVDTS